MGMERVIDGLMWADPTRIRSALEDFTPADLAQDLFRAAVEARLAEMEWAPPPELTIVVCKDPVITAFALVARLSTPATRRPEVRREARQLIGTSASPLAQLVRLHIAFLALFDGALADAVADAKRFVGDDRAHPGLVLGACRLGYEAAVRRGDPRRPWLDAGMPLIEAGAKGRRVAALWLAFSWEALWSDDADGAEAALDNALRHQSGARWERERRADILLWRGRAAEVLDLLENTPGVRASLRLAHANLLLDRNAACRAILDPLGGLGWLEARAYRWALLAAAGAQPSVTDLLWSVDFLPGHRLTADLYRRAVVTLPPNSPLEAGYRRAWALSLSRSGGDPAEASVVGPVCIGPYTLVRPVGRGANARVFEAVHEGTGRPAAVKVLLEPSVSRDDLAGEARILARMRHPNILGVNAVGTLDAITESLSGGELEAGAAWLAMELVSGGTLESLVGRLEWDELRDVLAALLAGLGHAHGAGVLHLDLKPANVLLSSEGAWRPRLADFGVFSLLSLARGRRIAGTPRYMPPEQWRGAALEPRSDLYAVGVLAFELITGRAPFDAFDHRALRELHESAPRPPLERASPELEAWVHELMAIEIADRPATAWTARRALLALDQPTLPTVESRFAAAETVPLTRELASGDQGPLVRSISPTATDTEVDPWTFELPPSLPVDIAPELAIEAMEAGALRGLESIQHALWRALRMTARDRSRVVVVEGSSEALFRWFVRTVRGVGLPAEEVDGIDGGRGAEIVKRLGVGPSVVVVRSRPPGIEGWVESLSQLPCLVLAKRWSKPDQRFAVPRLSSDVLIANLQDRLPLHPDTADAIARTSGGLLQHAFDVLKALVLQDGLEPRVLGWALRDPDALEGDRRDTLRDVAMALSESDPELGRALAIHALARRPVSKLDIGPFTDSDGYLLGGVADVLVERWGGASDVLAEAEAMATSPSARASIAVRMGNPDRAFAIMGDALERQDAAYARSEVDALLLEMRSWRIRLPGVYHFFYAGVLTRRGATELARLHLREAAADPQIRDRALLMLAAVGPPANRIAELETLVAHASPEEVDAAQVNLGLALCRVGRVQEGRAVFGASNAPRARGWAAYFALPRTRSEAWWGETTGDDAFPFAVLRACALVLWGQGHIETGALGPPGQAAVLALRQVARGDHSAIAERLHRQEAALTDIDWSNPLRWFAAVRESQAQWEQITSRWPCDRYSPIAVWLLEQALIDCPVTRAPDIRAVLDRWPAWE